jgi:hypothetical protein
MMIIIENDPGYDSSRFLASILLCTHHRLVEPGGAVDAAIPALHSKL